jgi:hypothetical protein
MSIHHVSSQLSAAGPPMLFTRRATTLIDSLLLSLHYVSAIVFAPPGPSSDPSSYGPLGWRRGFAHLALRRPASRRIAQLHPLKARC